MAGWSILTDGCALDCNEILQNLQSNGFCLDLDSSLKGDVDGGKDKLRCLFDQILSVFLKEISVSKDSRPLPAMLGDGRSVDLFKLFWVVRERGGYDSVSKNGSWASVAEESGLDSSVTSSVKLIYIKYLDTLDRWFRRILRGKAIGSGLSDRNGNLDLFSVEVQTEFRGLLSEMLDQKEKDEEFPQLDSRKNEMHQSVSGNMYNTHEVSTVPKSDCTKKCVDDNDKEVVILDSSVFKENPHSCKRKLEFLSGMLNWVTELAKHPAGPEIGALLKGSDWNMCGGKELLGQALLARDALFLRRHVDSSDEQSLLQKKQKIHPSIYEDHVDADDQSIERLRCSERILLKKSHSRSGSKSPSASQNDLDVSPSHCVAGLENHPDKQLVTVDSWTANIVIGLFGDDQRQKHVPVGSLFQVEVPDWTGMTSESDSKWLGTRVWPLETGEHNLRIERDPIGKGREDSCDCRLPGSVECVRFHIAEKRMRVKLELGSAFHRWKFNRMGEEVSLPWTVEEEKRFKAIVRLNPPSLYKCFWDQVFRCFRTKSRENLVSYYFNVFLLQRRSYQNRVTPNSIDSDDDESEFGSLSNGFGHEAIKVPGSKSVFCAQNKQCIDLE
ncbi:hypothetical protein HHK36_027681 [Tetracentron sinense]|uniref:ARID domain-containing protein n=1 Tax=Tetracentron sinense TaxID=13715 RepID=A0A834YI82_TETSI|nr:hypothetical protein HHK36_027681 [Tetracentron sinense]